MDCQLLANIVAKVENRTTPNLANVDFWSTPPPLHSEALTRSSVVVFVRNDGVPRIATCETHQRPEKFRSSRRRQFLDAVKPRFSNERGRAAVVGEGSPMRGKLKEAAN
jgi:hypothetical protein